MNKIQIKNLNLDSVNKEIIIKNKGIEKIINSLKVCSLESSGENQFVISAITTLIFLFDLQYNLTGKLFSLRFFKLIFIFFFPFLSGIRTLELKEIFAKIEGSTNDKRIKNLINIFYQTSKVSYFYFEPS